MNEALVYGVVTLTRAHSRGDGGVRARPADLNLDAI